MQHALLCSFVVANLRYKWTLDLKKLVSFESLLTHFAASIGQVQHTQVLNKDCVHFKRVSIPQSLSYTRQYYDYLRYGNTSQPYRTWYPCNVYYKFYCTVEYYVMYEVAHAILFIIKQNTALFLLVISVQQISRMDYSLRTTKIFARRLASHYNVSINQSIQPIEVSAGHHRSPPSCATTPRSPPSAP